MRIECIAIGTELLTTERIDTNSVWIAARLTDMGLALSRKTVVGDDREALRCLFREALERSHLIVCTGGLGPTFDDFTKEVMAEVLGANLVEDESVRHEIEAFFSSLGRPMTPNNLKQALVPLGAEVLHNPRGTAPGIFWENPAGYPGRCIALLPGVPREMQYLWEHEIEPRLEKARQRPIRALRMLVGSVGESALESRTAALREKHGQLDWTILAGLGTVELIARSADEMALRAARNDFESELGPDLIGVGPDKIEAILLSRLASRRETLALAESMTGGLIASRLTAVPGASEVLLGGAVVYSPYAKTELAGVDAGLIAIHGTVSEATTRALAEGIRLKLGSTWALSVTGNAGPTEDRSGKAPIGTCHIAVSGPPGTSSQSRHFPGERAVVQARTATWALDFLRRSMPSG